MDLDVDQFFKEMESVMKCPGEAANSNIEEGSSSDLDFGKISIFIYYHFYVYFVHFNSFGEILFIY